MISTIVNGSAATGTLTGQYTHSDVNALLVSMDRAFADADYLTVQLVSKLHDRRVLVNRISLTKLQSISNIRYGHSLHLQEAINAATGVTTDYVGFCLAVDLGCAKLLANESEIQVSLELGSAADVSVASLYYQDGPDVVRQWLESTVLSDSFADLEELYLVSLTEVLDPSGTSLSALVNGPRGSYLANGMDLFGAAAILGEVEAHGPQNAALVYRCAGSITRPVHVQITGTTTGYSLIGCQRIMDARRVSRGVMHAYGLLESELLSMTPEARRAYRRAGMAPHPEWVRRIKPTLNEGIDVKYRSMATDAAGGRKMGTVSGFGALG